MPLADQAASCWVARIGAADSPGTSRGGNASRPQQDASWQTCPSHGRWSSAKQRTLSQIRRRGFAPASAVACSARAFPTGLTWPQLGPPGLEAAAGFKSRLLVRFVAYGHASGENSGKTSRRKARQRASRSHAAPVVAVNKIRTGPLTWLLPPLAGVALLWRGSPGLVARGCRVGAPSRTLIAAVFLSGRRGNYQPMMRRAEWRRSSDDERRRRGVLRD